MSPSACPFRQKGTTLKAMPSHRIPKADGPTQKRSWFWYGDYRLQYNRIWHVAYSEYSEKGIV